MTVARTKKEQFLPWAWSKFGFRFEVASARLDANRPANVDAERRLIDLDEPWDRATLDLRIDVPAELLSRVLAPKDSGRLTALITLRCDDTRLRRGVRVAVPRAGGAVECQLDLDRSELSGTAELGAVLVRESAAQTRTSGFAAAAGARLADTRPWELRVDRRRTLTGVYLDVRYRNFKEDETIPKEQQENLYRLDINEHPILWLNSAHPGVTGILNSKGHVGKRAILREVVYDLIVPVVWIRLFSHAADQLRHGEEAAYSWQESVLDAAARLLVPTRKDTEDARERLEAELEDFSGLLERLDGALQAQHALAKHVVRLAEELE